MRALEKRKALLGRLSGCWPEYRQLQGGPGGGVLFLPLPHLLSGSDETARGLLSLHETKGCCPATQGGESQRTGLQAGHGATPVLDVAREGTSMYQLNQGLLVPGPILAHWLLSIRL